MCHTSIPCELKLKLRLKPWDIASNFEVNEEAKAAIVSGITKEVITSLKTSAVNEIAKLVCVKKEIKNLTVTFDDICAQIRGADQIVAHSEATNYRLKLLREYAYEAENIIDLFTDTWSVTSSTTSPETSPASGDRALMGGDGDPPHLVFFLPDHVLVFLLSDPGISILSAPARLPLEATASTGAHADRRCSRSIPLRPPPALPDLLGACFWNEMLHLEVGVRYKAANDIQELNKKLERITPTLLQELCREDRQSNITTPQHDEFITIGRNIANECDNLFRLLRGNQAGQCLFAIVGAVGVGKTTLAQKIYHDTRNNFRTRLWVHVSNDSRNLGIWRGESFLGTGETAVQRVVLREYLINDRYRRLLLVIDNVWEENGWNQFLGQDFCRGGDSAACDYTT
uniref:NB-ARC domain-containing protein n=1 Tax=Oryza rufipogon TaxID=4529 RepID=A0A0E0QPJ3_ORYRU